MPRLIFSTFPIFNRKQSSTPMRGKRRSGSKTKIFKRTVSIPPMAAKPCGFRRSGRLSASVWTEGNASSPRFESFIVGSTPFVTLKKALILCPPSFFLSFSCASYKGFPLAAAHVPPQNTRLVWHPSQDFRCVTFVLSDTISNLPF